MMSTGMKCILERLLSEELARQEIWAKKDKEDGIDYDRTPVMREIVAFMKANDIRFNNEVYINEFVKKGE